MITRLAFALLLVPAAMTLAVAPAQGGIVIQTSLNGGFSPVTYEGEVDAYVSITPRATQAFTLTVGINEINFASLAVFTGTSPQGESGVSVGHAGELEIVITDTTVNESGTISVIDEIQGLVYNIDDGQGGFTGQYGYALTQNIFGLQTDPFVIGLYKIEFLGVIPGNVRVEEQFVGTIPSFTFLEGDYTLRMRVTIIPEPSAGLLTAIGGLVCGAGLARRRAGRRHAA